MASSGTILPSISTFANPKEKCWEDRFKVDLGGPASLMMDTQYSEDLQLDLEFILANSMTSDVGPSPLGVDESFRHQEDPCSTASMYQHQHHLHQPPNYASVQPDMSSPPPPYSTSLMAELLHADVVDTSFCGSGTVPAPVQGRFMVSTSPFHSGTQDLVYPEPPGIKVEPASPLDVSSSSSPSYGPVLGMAPHTGAKIKHEGSSGSCMMSFEAQPRLASSPQAAVGSMTPPLTPDDLLSSECHQQHMCRAASLGFPQSFHPHRRTPPGGYPGMQLPFPHHHHHHHHHHQFPGMYHGDDTALAMQQQQQQQQGGGGRAVRGSCSRHRPPRWR